MDQNTFCEAVLSCIRHASLEERRAIQEELTAHIEDHAEALEQGGYSPKEAMERAVEAMGEPQEIGREMDQQYPLGWLVLSRVALIASVLLVCMMLTAFSLLGNLTNSITARIAPGKANFISALDPAKYDVIREVDLTVQIGDDILRVSQIGLKHGVGEEGKLGVALCNYDRNLFGIASQQLLHAVSFTEEKDSYYKGYETAGGGGNSGAHYWVTEGIRVDRSMETVPVIYDAYGEQARLELPIPWEVTA